MAQFEIKHWITGAVLYAGGGETLRDVVVAAVKASADLRGAYLSSADLSGRELIGDRPILQIGPIGSRGDYLIAHITDAGIVVLTGCFCDSLDLFRAAVNETHGDSAHGREYAAAISMIEAHAELWSPAVEVAETTR